MVEEIELNLKTASSLNSKVAIMNLNDDEHKEPSMGNAFLWHKSVTCLAAMSSKHFTEGTKSHVHKDLYLDLKRQVDGIIEVHAIKMKLETPDIYFNILNLICKETNDSFKCIGQFERWR